jgi:hypothetical protein
MSCAWLRRKQCPRLVPPPSQHFTQRGATAESSECRTCKGYADGPLTNSQTLRTERVVVTGPVLPESTQNEPDPTTIVIAGPVGRWIECVWVEFYDAWVEAFEEVSNQDVLYGSNSN